MNTRGCMYARWAGPVMGVIVPSVIGRLPFVRSAAEEAGEFPSACRGFASMIASMSLGSREPPAKFVVHARRVRVGH